VPQASVAGLARTGIEVRSMTLLALLALALGALAVSFASDPEERRLRYRSTTPSRRWRPLTALSRISTAQEGLPAR
jgi:hypothetical protein